jgi:basic membrane protein A and related proteins
VDRFGPVFGAKMKRVVRVGVVISAVVLAVGSLSGCSKSTSEKSGDSGAVASTDVPSDSGVPADASTATPPSEALAANALAGKTVVYLINGALGDKGFYDSGQQGIKNLETAYGAKTRTLEANYDAAKYQSLVDAAFEEADAIFAISYGFEDALKAGAKAHPEVPVVNLDFDIADKDGNVSSIDFIEEESAFLAGAAAALTTIDKTIPGVNPEKKIGVVSGDTDPVTASFMFAYENGAKSIDSAIVVERKSLGGAWDDQAKGKQAAEQLFDSGSDVVFQVAAAAGLGVLQAAKERGKFAIGVDANQNDLQPGHVIASDIKNVGGSIEKIAATIAEGTYEKGQVLSYGIEAGGVDLDISATTPVLPEAIAGKIDALRAEIVAGTLKVARYKP